MLGLYFLYYSQDVLGNKVMSEHACSTHSVFNALMRYPAPIPSFCELSSFSNFPIGFMIVNIHLSLRNMIYTWEGHRIIQFSMHFLKMFQELCHAQRTRPREESTLFSRTQIE